MMRSLYNSILKSIKYCNIALQLDNMRCKSNNTLKNYVKNTYNDNSAVFYNYTNSNTFFSIFANEFLKIGIILYDIKDMRKDVLRSDK